MQATYDPKKGYSFLNCNITPLKGAPLSLAGVPIAYSLFNEYPKWANGAPLVCSWQVTEWDYTDVAGVTDNALLGGAPWVILSSWGTSGYWKSDPSVVLSGNLAGETTAEGVIPAVVFATGDPGARIVLILQVGVGAQNNAMQIILEAQIPLA